MPNQLIEYRLRIRNAADSADAVVITSQRGGTNPYLSSDPKGDGASFDPTTGACMAAAYTGQIGDWPIGSMQRAITSQLEDVNGKQQLGYRKVFLEFQVNGGGFTGNVLIGGVLTLLRLTSAMEWEYTIQDYTRAQNAVAAFGVPFTTSLTTYLTTFSTNGFSRGCVFGGPFYGALAFTQGFRDLGGWQMRVNRLGTNPNYRYYLEPTAVYGAPDWTTGPRPKLTTYADAINDAVAGLLQNLAATATITGTPFTTIGDVLSNTLWHGLVYLIQTFAGGAWIPFRPVYAGPYLGLYTNPDNPQQLVNTLKGKLGVFCVNDGQTPLTPGAIVSVRCLTALPSELSPIYYDGPPTRLITGLWAAANIPFDASAWTAFESVIGTTARYMQKFTTTPDIGPLVNAICLAYGIGIRYDNQGRLVPFRSRVMSNAPPATTITSADVVDGSTTLPFELDTAGALNQINVTQKMYQPTPVAGAQVTTLDGVTENDATFPFLNEDTTALQFGALDLTVPGMMHTDKSVTPLAPDAFKPIAREFFDRAGHGNLAIETTFLRGGAGDSLDLGDECLIQLPQLPNANYRLGDNPAIAARAMQIVRMTRLASGKAVRLLDSGPNAQPLATVPTLSIAASTDAPRRAAVYTITNAAALNALGYAVRIRWVGNTGATPAAGDYVVTAYFAAGVVPTIAQQLPAVAAGSTVWAEGQSENKTGRPSGYGTAAHVTLSAVADPTSVTAVPSTTDASLCALAWVPGSGTANDLVDIWLRASGTVFSTAVRQRTINPGSIGYTLEGLTTGVPYIATVQYRDPATQDVSNPIDVSFTAGGTTRTLSTPVNPVGFAGTPGVSGQPQRDGLIGLAVIATELPGTVGFEVAVETSIGSGAYGSFNTMATETAIADDWTIGQQVVPNDGLRRQLRARGIGDGVNASSYTSVVTITPWTPLALPPFAAASHGSTSIDPIGGDTASQATVSFRVDMPVSALSARYAFSTSSQPVDSTTQASGTIVSSGRSFNVPNLVTLALGDPIFITIIPFTGPSATGTPLPSLHLQDRFQTFATAKSVRVGALDFKAYPGAAAVFYNASGSYLRPATAISGSFFAYIKGIPAGVPVIQFTVRLYRETGVGNVFAQVFRVDSSGVTHGPVGGTQVHSTTGWQTLSGSATDTSDGSDYLVQCVLDPTGEPTADSVRIAWANLDYTAIDAAKPGAG